ncbi:MAG TPA: FAD-dependent monooxygenase [Pyrinomonadaceae bacterium]|jgi:2-polyprenyl-6-methoxyphenol hydroxylase-like FAD-dependent oxidoreductase
MGQKREKIIIVGGGIGGLTTAIALRRQGFEVAVMEQAEELREIGAGLSVWPNATGALERLGLLARVLERSEVLERLQLRTWKGELLSNIRTVADFRTPSVCIHRADLLSVLQEEIPAECVHLGQKFEDFEELEGVVTAASSGGLKVSGDALVGADGLNSAVRGRVLGPSKPVYRGYWACRGVARFRLPESYARTATETWGAGQRFGIEPMGRGRVFWYATANAPEGALGDQPGWKEELLRKFGQWHSPIPELIEATEGTAILKHEIQDRPAVRRWGEGRVTLLGDAAHPTTPNLGQGACMAIEDALVLAQCLRRDEEMGKRLRRYESLRFKRTEYITRESRRAGWIGQIENALAVKLRSVWLRALPAFFIKQRHRSYYAFEA